MMRIDRRQRAASVMLLVVWTLSLASCFTLTVLVLFF
jgi:hypothetical protein